MTIQNLELINFRSYGDISASFSPSVNVITGNNAVGKTNLIESIYYLSVLKPIRPGKDSDLIKKGETQAKVKAKIESGQREIILEALFSHEGRKQLLKNGIKKKTGAEFAGILKTVLFCPDDLMLIKDSSAQRRRLVDCALSQLRPAYYLALSEYNKLLGQKNEILKNYEDKPSLLDLLPVYNEKMAVLGGKIIYIRNAYIKNLETAASINLAVSGGADELEIKYRSLSNIEDTALPETELSGLIREHQKTHASAELASKTCLSGPHKDDILIFINKNPAKNYASQGQIRSAVLSMKLSERGIFYRDSGEYPVLLLDDVLSELDPSRQSFVLNKIPGGQVFITCCSRQNCSLSGKRLMKKTA